MPGTIQVLLVEDNTTVSSSIEKYFSKIEDIQIIGIARDSLQAIDVLGAKAPDIIILDIVMPRSDGFVLLRHLNECLYDKTPKVIVLTSLNNDATIHAANKLGATYFLAKPVYLEVLHKRIRQIHDMNRDIETVSSSDQHVGS